MIHIFKDQVYWNSANDEAEADAMISTDPEPGETYQKVTG